MKEVSELSKQLGLYEVTKLQEIVTLIKVLREEAESDTDENTILADLQLIDQLLHITKTRFLLNKGRGKKKLKDLLQDRIDFELGDDLTSSLSVQRALINREE